MYQIQMLSEECSDRHHLIAPSSVPRRLSIDHFTVSPELLDGTLYCNVYVQQTKEPSDSSNVGWRMNYRQHNYVPLPSELGFDRSPGVQSERGTSSEESTLQPLIDRAGGSSVSCTSIIHLPTVYLSLMKPNMVAA